MKRVDSPSTGPGTAARVLAYFFPHVAVSDAGENNVKTAMQYLQPPGNFSFRRAPAEEEWLPSASIDFASVCMAFHYLDEDAAVRAIANSLRPGGTLAAVTYSFMLKFPAQPEVEKLWFEVLSAETDAFARSGKLFPAAIRGCSKAMTGLDYVPLPEDLFEPGALRLQINVQEDDRNPFLFAEPSADTYVLPEKRIGPSDIVRFVADDGWRKQCTVDWLKGFLVSCHLGFSEQTWALPGWKELEGVVAAIGGEILVEWPVAVILATRRHDAAKL